MPDKWKYYPDCRHFRGDIPCKPHKSTGVHCYECKDYEPCDGIILIVKFGAAGDVIRTTPLLYKIKSEYPTKLIWWLTYSPELVPSFVDKVFAMTPEAILTLQATYFDIVINLDKDNYACALAESLRKDKLFGFGYKNGKPAAANESAEHKYITGLFDDANQSNTKSYLEEIFEICGWQFSGEEYIVECIDYDWNIDTGGKRLVGLNTGCGSRWTSRLWRDDYWKELTRMLIEKGYYPILLGGEQEHSKNLQLSEETGALYLGYFPLDKFISLTNQCDIIVTAVTMALHIAIGLKKKVVLMNNIFNRNEFELYGRGAIVEPEKQCRCFFSPKCKSEDYFCLDSLTPQMIIDAVEKL